MVWNVYYQDINQKEIKVWNVFNHRLFNNEVITLLKRRINREEFEKKFRNAAMYYFWSRSEFEIILTSWPPYITEEELTRLNAEKGIYRHIPQLEVEEKIDIFQQLNLNWDVFVDYVWSQRKSVREKKIND